VSSSVQEKMRIACKFLVVKPKGKDSCEDGRIILKCILRKRRWNVDWILVAQDRDQRWAFLNTVVDIVVP